VTGRPTQAETAPSAPARTPDFDQNSDRTRDQLQELFQRYPPTLMSVLRLDPTLLTNAGYLAPYPALAAFLAQHPEIAHNPTYFIGPPGFGAWQTRSDPELVRARAGTEFVETSLLFTGWMAVLGVIAWMLKMLVDHRRFLRTSRIQTDAHTKLLDRLTSNEELLAYVQSPAGRRFLEAMPPQAAAQAPGAAPIGRILFTVQAGTVASLVGLGLMFLSRYFRGADNGFSEISPALLMFGIVLLSGGIGFMISAVAAYKLSKQLGLFSQPDSSHA
jgi:hypothetical protein